MIPFGDHYAGFSPHGTCIDKTLAKHPAKAWTKLRTKLRKHNVPIKRLKEEGYRVKPVARISNTELRD